MRAASGRPGSETGTNAPADSPRCLVWQFNYEQGTLDGAPTLEMYQKCCRKFVTYLAVNMETSSGFAQEMEKMIDASYRNSSVRSLVVQDLWLCCDAHDAHSRQESGAVLRTPAHQSTANKMDTDTNVVVTPFAIASAIRARPTCSPHADLAVSTPSNLGRGAKRQKRTASVPSKRAKQHTVSRNLYSTGSLTEASDTETETEGEVDQEPERQAPAVPQQDKGNEDFVWPCVGVGATERSDAFIRHLKTALVLVDAENCAPPSAMVCTHGCDQMRNSMCATHREQGGKAMPCHDGMCLVWCIVDKHLVRCQDSQCEFKNRVGLRQSQHDIQRNEVKLEETTRKLQAAKAILAQDGSQSACNMAKAQLESKIERLENKCSKLEDAVGFHKEREHTFWADLSSIGVHRGSDGMNGLPSFESHYARQ